MPKRTVTFTTDANPKEIRKALLSLPGHTYFEIDEPKQKAVMSDHKQLIIIWLLAILALVIVTAYIMWETKP